MATTPTVPAVRLHDLHLDAALPDGRRFVSAASGLVTVDDAYLVIADDGHHVAWFPREGGATGRAVRVLDGDLPTDQTDRKRRKPDFEAITRIPDGAGPLAGFALMMGSGSTAARVGALVIDPVRRTVAARLGLEPLYGPLCDAIGTINVEAAIWDAAGLMLVSRANGSSPTNRVARFAAESITRWVNGDRGPCPPQSIDDLRLGDVNGVPFGITDAATHPAGGWVFSAVAEDTMDGYADGAVAGSAVGVVAPDGRSVRAWALTPAIKVEGIAVERSAGDGGLELTMVTDPDDPDTVAALYRTTLRGV